MGAPGTNTGICLGARWPEYDKWFERAHHTVFNPGTAKPLAVSLWFHPSTVGGAILSKDGEYELLFQSGKLLFRLASNTGGGSWDKEVELSHSILSGWHLAILWIVPGVEIGLCLDGGTPETEPLAPGQAARVANGTVRIGYPAPPPPSSSWHYSSSHYYPSSSGWPLAAEVLASPSPYVGLVDEIAVFNAVLDGGFRSMLWNSGYGYFWHSSPGVWGPCGWWPSSSWHWSSSYHYPSSSSSWHWSSHYSYPGSWAMFGGEEERDARTGQPVTAGLLAQAASDPPELVLCQYVWGARAGHRDELFLRDRDPEGGGGPLDERLYCAMDYFDPVAVVDAEGEVVERYGFTAFGRREVMAPDWSPREGSEFEWSFGFHGQFLDAETGYYNYGFRYYVPWLGRWPNRDPIGEEGGRNVYGFVENQPTRSIDLLGQQKWTVASTFRVTSGGGGNETRIQTWESTWDTNDIDNGCYYELEIKTFSAIVSKSVAIPSLALHEAQHVQDYQDSWSVIVDSVNYYDGWTATCKEEVECWGAYLDLVKEWNRWNGIRKAALLHKFGKPGVTAPYPALLIPQVEQSLRNAEQKMASLRIEIQGKQATCPQLCENF